MSHRRSLPAVVLAALLGSACWQPEPRQDGGVNLTAVAVPGDLGERAMDHVRTVVGFGERYSYKGGETLGWKKQLDHVAEQLRSYGLRVHRDRFADSAEEIVFENIAATLPGTLDDRVVIACHHDTKRTSGHAEPHHNFPFVGANDGGSGVGLLLALAETLAARPEKPAATLEFVFFDGEESQEFDWNMQRALFGSRHYVRGLRLKVPGRANGPVRAMLLLDLVGAADLQIDDDSNSDQRLKRILAAAAEVSGFGDGFFRHAQTVSDDHLPFVDAGIPAAVLIDLYDNPQWHTADDTLDHLSAASLQRVGAVVLTALPEVVRQFVTNRKR